MQKKNSIFNMLLIILLSVLLGLIACLVFNLKKTKVFTQSIEGKLVISTFSSNSIGKVTLYDPVDRNEISVVDNRNVGVTGDISYDGSKVAYVDALSDTDSWQVYVRESNKTQVKKITDSNFGKVNPKFVDSNIVYFLTGNSNGLVKVGKVNIDSKESTVIDEENDDRQVDCFDARNNKIIMSTTLNSLVEKNFEENNGEDKPITHTIYQANNNEKSLNKIIEFQASTVYSISYNFDCTKVIIGGLNINENKGEGIYELSLENGKITTILNEDLLLNSDVSEFANPNIAKVSRDENFIYFTAVPKNSKEIEIDGIKCYPTAIFRYDIKEGSIKEVYNPEEASFIFDFNIKY